MTPRRRLHPVYPDVLVLVGTQTGNTELVAGAVAARLGDLGFTSHVLDMADTFPEMLAEYRQLVVALCTWADGTYPDNALDFTTALDDVAPPLEGVSFAVIGLGDRAYEPYYQTAAERLRDRLASLGAREVVPMLAVDGAPSKTHLARARTWATGLGEEFMANG